MIDYFSTLQGVYMDINCTLNCIHQQNGKCALIIIPAFVQSITITQAEYDCAYFEEKL